MPGRKSSTSPELRSHFVPHTWWSELMVRVRVRVRVRVGVRG